MALNQILLLTYLLTYFTNMFQVNSSIHTQNTRQKEKIHQLRHKLRWWEVMFSPTSVCRTTSWCQFKSKCHQTSSVIPLITGDELIKFWSRSKVNVGGGGMHSTERPSSYGLHYRIIRIHYPIWIFFVANIKNYYLVIWHI